MKLNWNFLLPIIGLVITNITPELRAEITQTLDKMELKAKATKNPFDNLAVMLLKGIFSV